MLHSFILSHECLNFRVCMVPFYRCRRLTLLTQRQHLHWSLFNKTQFDNKKVRHSNRGKQKKLIGKGWWKAYVACLYSNKMHISHLYPKENIYLIISNKCNLAEIFIQTCISRNCLLLAEIMHEMLYVLNILALMWR